MKSKYNSQRELIARAIVVENGAFVVNKSHNSKTGEEYYALPGGHVEPGETCVEALEREWQEELGGKLRVLDLCFVAESMYTGRKQSDEKRHELTLFFHGEVIDALQHNSVEIMSPEPSKNFQWLRFEDLETANLLPDTVKEFLQATLIEEEIAHYAFSDSTRDAKN